MLDSTSQELHLNARGGGGQRPPAQYERSLRGQGYKGEGQQGQQHDPNLMLTIPPPEQYGAHEQHQQQHAENHSLAGGGYHYGENGVAQEGGSLDVDCEGAMLKQQHDYHRNYHPSENMAEVLEQEQQRPQHLLQYEGDDVKQDENLLIV